MQKPVAGQGRTFIIQHTEQTPGDEGLRAFVNQFSQLVEYKIGTSQRLSIMTSANTSAATAVKVLHRFEISSLKNWMTSGVNTGKTALEPPGDCGLTTISTK